MSAAPAYHLGSFRLYDLAVENRYYRETTLPSLQAPPPVDSQGVPLFAWRGELYYHPVVMAQRALRLLDGYRQTKDDRYLAGARVVAREDRQGVLDGERSALPPVQVHVRRSTTSRRR